MRHNEDHKVENVYPVTLFRKHLLIWKLIKARTMFILHLKHKRHLIKTFE